MELVQDLTVLTIETLDTDFCVAASGENHFLSGDKSNGINDWVQNIATRCDIPNTFSDRSLQVTEVPNLHTLTQGSTTSHNILIVM